MTVIHIPPYRRLCIAVVIADLPKARLVHAKIWRVESLFLLKYLIYSKREARQG